MIKAFGDQIIRFRKDERGVFLVIFAILALVLIATSGAVVDFTRVQQARTRAQGALDAAALALQAKIDDNGVTAATLKVDAQALLTERIADSSVTAVVEAATPDTTAGKLTITGYITVPTYFVQLVGVTSIRSSMLSEVTRSSSDLEVSMALDVTQSMSGTKIDALIDATNSLIDQVVQTSQTPTYSKMALAPYSMAVNLGSYVDEARGDIVMGHTVSTLTWSSGTAKTISAITKANPAVVTTTTAHGLVNGDPIYINGVTGMTQVTTGVYCVGTNASTTTTTFRLKKFTGTNCNTNVNSSSYNTYTGTAGRVTKCANVICQLLVTTSADHGFANDDAVHIVGVSGVVNNTINYSGSNKKLWTVKNKTNTTFIAENSSVTNLTTATTNGTGGTASCTKYGCNYYSYETVSGTYNLYRPTDCAVERPTTTEAATDMNPTDAPVGFYYNSSGNDCLTAEILPLTSDKDDLHDLVDSLSVAGSTAGQIGLAWAWYMISPNFIDEDIETPWPVASVPADYGEANLIKAVILMTDGIFNTMYEHGVPSEDSSSLSGGDTVRSTNNSPLGNSIAQAEALCTSIKTPANKTILYTVGFDIGSNSTEDVAARTFLSGCASPGGYFYQADDADDLQDAFDSIASSLSELRLSK